MIRRSSSFSFSLLLLFVAKIRDFHFIRSNFDQQENLAAKIFSFSLFMLSLVRSIEQLILCSKFEFR